MKCPPVNLVPVPVCNKFSQYRSIRFHASSGSSVFFTRRAGDECVPPLVQEGLGDKLEPRCEAVAWRVKVVPSATHEMQWTWNERLETYLLS